jgi:hypothetical protein
MIPSPGSPTAAAQAGDREAEERIMEAADARGLGRFR